MPDTHHVCRDDHGRFASCGGAGGTGADPGRTIHVNYSEGGQRTAREIFGRDVPAHEIAGMVGALDGAKVQVTVVGQSLEVVVRHQDYYAMRQLYRQGSDVICNNHTIRVHTTGQGTGTKVFATQVEHLAHGGVKEIHASCKRDDANKWNGYSTWPKLGYNGPIPDKVRGNFVSSLFGRGLPKPFREAKTVRDLLSMPGGRDWWQKNGDTAKMTFDLRHGSASRQILQEYVNRRRGKSLAVWSLKAADRSADVEEIDLTEDETADLNHFWDRVAETSAATGRLPDWKEVSDNELDLVLYVCDQKHLHLVALKDDTEVHSDTIMGLADGFLALKSACRDERGRFAPCGAGGHAPAALQRIRAERYRKAREMVAAIKAGPRPVPHEKIRELTDHLGTMTNAQLTSLRNEHGLKGGRVKDQLKQKITEHLAGKPGSAGAHARDHVPEGTFGEPKNLRWNPDQDQAELREAITRFIGPHGTKEQLAACAGAVDGASVSVEKSSYRPGHYTVTFTGSQGVRDPDSGYMIDQHFNATRTMRIENGKKRIHNDYFRGEGAGVSMFGRQVENATKHGFDQIDTHAAGQGSGTPGQHSTGHYNGYYTWPRFGYNAAVPATPAQRLPAHLKEAVIKADGKMSGLMKTKEGRDWWMGHGQELLHAVFDLTKGSYSQNTLNTYLHERNILK